MKGQSSKRSIALEKVRTTNHQFQLLALTFFYVYDDVEHEHILMNTTLNYQDDCSLSHGRYDVPLRLCEAIVPTQLQLQVDAPRRFFFYTCP